MCFKRKAILMIHGFIGGVYDYNNFPNELEMYNNFDVFTFTLPGHEKTIVNGVKYSEWIKEAERQIELLIEHNYKNIYVIGHSMGGVIAAHLASKYCQVKKLVLVAPAFGYFCFKDGEVNIKDISKTFTSVSTIFKGIDKNAVLERIIKTPLSTMLEFTKLVKEYKNDTQQIICPILIIHGIEDNIVPTEATKYVHESVKSKTNILINMKDVNHDCFSKKRQKDVKEIITTFLRKRQPKKVEERNI